MSEGGADHNAGASHSSDRERLKGVVETLEDILENGQMGETARYDVQQARDYAAGAVHIFNHGGNNAD